MAQLVALMSGVVLGGVAEISLEAKYLQYLSAQLIHYIPPCIYIYMQVWLKFYHWFRR